MKSRFLRFASLAISASASLMVAHAQHLWWGYKPSATGYTCLYGEVQVVATSPTIYYCGCNWWPGAPAGGYTGIQDPGGGRHNMIFSIWDTSPDLHPKTVAQDERTVASRFGGEGTGGHTHLDYHWEVGKSYRYYAVKRQDRTGANTLATVYFYDDLMHKWVLEATISSPNDKGQSVQTFGGGMNAFLENWSGQLRSAPKVAVYRLWLGTSPKDLTSVTDAGGDGKWGVLNDTFFLAEGEDSAVDAVLKGAVKGNAPLLRGDATHRKLSVSARTLPRLTVRQLEKLDEK